MVFIGEQHVAHLRPLQPVDGTLINSLELARIFFLASMLCTSIHDVGDYLYPFFLGRRGSHNLVLLQGQGKTGGGGHISTLLAPVLTVLWLTEAATGSPDAG